MNEQEEWLEESKKRQQQEKLHLRNTRICADMYRHALNKKLGATLIDELFKLFVASARDEWGDDATVDDFSEPGRFIISSKSKKKEEVL